MTLQPTTSALARTARLDAAQMSRAMAAVRLGIGAIGLLAPGRLAWRLFLQGRQIDEATALVLRAARTSAALVSGVTASAELFLAQQLTR